MWEHPWEDRLCSCLWLGTGADEPRCMSQSPSLWPYVPHVQACTAQLQVGGSNAELWAVDALLSGRYQLLLCWLPCLVPGESGP